LINPAFKFTDRDKNTKVVTISFTGIPFNFKQLYKLYRLSK
jgi:hypothetical protein